MRDHRSAWAAELTGNVHSSAPVPIVAALSSVGATAAYGSADKLYRYGLMSIVAVGNAAQGWVLETRNQERARRSRIAILAHVALGIIGWIGLTWLGGPVTSLLFGKDVAAPATVMFWLGAAFFAVSSSTPLIRNVLMPYRRDAIVLIATISGAVFGVVTMIFLTIALGPQGAACGLAISEFTVLLICAVGAAHATRSAQRDS